MSKARVNLDLLSFAISGLHKQNGQSFGKIEVIGQTATMRDFCIPIPMTVREYDAVAITSMAKTLSPEKEAEYDAILRVRQTAEVNRFIRIVREWLDDFDVVFSKTEVGFGRHEGFEDKGEFLRIKVTGTPVPVAEAPRGRREYA